MMKQCESCIFYDPQYDELREMWDDVSSDTEKHFCHLHDGHIPADIVRDEKQCDIRIPRKEVKV